MFVVFFFHFFFAVWRVASLRVGGALELVARQVSEFAITRLLFSPYPAGPVHSAIPAGAAADSTGQLFDQIGYHDSHLWICVRSL